MNEILLKLLNMRGISDEKSIEEFLSDSPKLTYDPLLLPDMDKGTDLILSEIKKNSKILIYGDYDADGITSTALMISVLSKMISKDRLGYFIPSRFEEGYGLNKDTIGKIHKEKYDLIITVDCGSLSKEEVKYAEELGMKVVVTDHHTITDTMADCILINPKRPDSIYPFKELSGCGVAFKVAQVLQKKAGLPKSVLNEILDLVAIGTIGDIMPLTDENRTMVKYGLKEINKDSRDGLKRLIDGVGLKRGNITSENIGFVVVPHLNASGRIEDATVAVKLLDSETSETEKEEIVNEIIYKNQERKRIQNEMFKKCIEMLSGTDEPDDFIMLKTDDGHEGIAGIVAGKLKEKFKRPVAVVIGEKGTSRSVDGLNLYDMLKSHEELFTKFGGHAGACGFTLPEENFEILRKKLNYDVSRIKEKHPEIFEKKLKYDLEINPEDITLELAEELEKMEPFGNKNPRPVFMMRNISPSDITYMGQEGRHVRFKAGKLKCILFSKAEEFKKALDLKEQIGITGFIEISNWQGQKRLQFVVEEITCGCYNTL